MEYEVVITYKCNWDCVYCCVDTHNNLLKESVIDKLNRIENNSKVILSGGEIGLLKETELLLYITILKSKNCTINVNTNGMFLSNYPHLLTHINKIYYHCSEDLDNTFTIYPNLNIEYLLIIHDDNIHKLGKFLESTNIKFYMVPASTPSTGIKDAPVLSDINKFKVLKLYSKSMTSKSKLRFIKEKDFSKTIYM